MDMIDDKKSVQMDQICKKDEQKMTEDIEVFKWGSFSSHKNIDNIENDSVEINRMDMSDDKYSDERYYKKK